MRLRDIFTRVIKDGHNCTHADIDDFAKAAMADVWIGWNKQWNERVKGYWFVRWLCTDTWVGRRVYFLDGEPLAVSHQSARKSDEYIEFVSEEMAQKCRAFIFELYGEGEPEFSIADLDREFEDTYNFDLSDYFLENKGFVDGEEVEIVERRAFPEGATMRWVSEHSVVRFKDGSELMVLAEDIHFPLLVNKGE